MPGRGSEAELDELLASLEAGQLREIVRSAAERHEDVERQIRLIVARTTGDLTQLRAEVDRGLRTRRFLGYREGMEWARTARPILAELEKAVDSAPSRELVELLQRAISHVIKVIHRADDSSGLIGGLARDLLELHARACDASVADPARLAAWMIRFRFTDQDFFEPDPVRYRTALGERGLAAYRTAVAAQRDQNAFAARYARERLAIIDGDSDQIVTLLGGDLTQPHQYIAVAEAMAELGRDDELLAWALRGIERTSGRQTGRLYDLACDTYTRRAAPLEVLALRRAQHERSPTSSTYSELRAAAETLHTWPHECAAARQALRRDPGGLIDALLAEGDTDLAWHTATSTPENELGTHRWLRLAEARQAEHPADALPVYWRAIEESLTTADRRAYAQALRILKRARTAATTAHQDQAFADKLAALRETHRRRPTLITMLNKAALD